MKLLTLVTPAAALFMATSSIAFSEADFAHMSRVAEPANAISAALSFVPLSLIGLFLGLSREVPHSDAQFVLLYVALGAIGVGSTLLHTTLRAATQAADELPMLWGCAALAFHFADDFLARRCEEDDRLGPGPQGGGPARSCSVRRRTGSLLVLEEEDRES